jgi:hypothetical protein
MRSSAPRRQAIQPDLIRGWTNEGLTLCIESLAFRSTSTTLTDKGRVELESRPGPAGGRANLNTFGTPTAACGIPERYSAAEPGPRPDE